MSPLVLLLLTATTQLDSGEVDTRGRLGVHASVSLGPSYGAAVSWEEDAFRARLEGHLAVDNAGISGGFVSTSAGMRLFGLGERTAGASAALVGLIGLGAVKPNTPDFRVGPLATLRLEVAYALSPSLSVELGAGASFWWLLVGLNPFSIGTAEIALLPSGSIGLVF